MAWSRIPSIILSFILLALATSIFVSKARAEPSAATRYVSPTGWDVKNVGGIPFPNLKCKQTNPCKTISWAVQVVAQSGDTVSVAAGTYNENIIVRSSKSVTITGAGTRKTIVDGGAHGSVLLVESSASAQLGSMRIQNGSAAEGGGVFVAGGATAGLQAVTLVNNQGGGIANYGTLTLTKVTLYHNHAGGLVNHGTATLDQTNVEVNDTSSVGGGAGITNQGTMTVTNSAIFENTTATGYPGISNSGGTLNLSNVTISGNTGSAPTNMGGAINNTAGSVILNYVTITGNTAAKFGAIYSATGTVGVEISNSIIYGNGPAAQCGGFGISEFRDDGYNVWADTSCGTNFGSPSLVANPKLLALGSNGGYTPTHALKSSSPAIDLVPKGKCTPRDQRGISRPIDGNGDGKAKCDAGAYEYP